MATSVKRALIAILCSMITTCATAATFAPARAQGQSATTLDPAFEKVWSHTDLPVAQHVVNRGWAWGPEPFFTGDEPYAQGPGGKHQVAYFDKGRMEINDPSANPNSPGFVTSGLLVVEMISGKVRLGVNQTVQSTASDAQLAGDPTTSRFSPTYSSLAPVASLNNDNRKQDRTGRAVQEVLQRGGQVTVIDNPPGTAKYATYEATLGHNIPDVFWTYLNQQETVYQNGIYQLSTVIDWLFVMGYPITEPYWIQIRVGGQDKWVLMQAFQRRILSYTPDNPAGWQVQMGNVGRAYYDWRYKQAPQTTSTALVAPVKPNPIWIAILTLLFGALAVIAGTLPARPSIEVKPLGGTTGTAVAVTGENFPPGAPIVFSIEKPHTSYIRGVGHASPGAGGGFQVSFVLPDDAQSFSDVTLTATAEGTGVETSQAVRMQYGPEVVVASEPGLVVSQDFDESPSQADTLVVPQAQPEGIAGSLAVTGLVNGVSSDGQGS